jgi:hypothetical protein
MEFRKTQRPESGAPATDNQNSRTARASRDPESNVVRLALTLNQYFLYQYKECLRYWVYLTIYFTHKLRQSRNMRFLCSSQDQRTVAGEVFFAGCVERGSENRVRL